MSERIYSGASRAVTLTAAFARRGRISAKPARKIPYAASTPNAIAKIAAQINITKLKASAIFF
jgi:hypothetical protein